MVAELTKTTVKLGGVVLAANSGMVWQLQTGTRPFTTVFSVHKDDWDKLRDQVGHELDLEIVDGRSVTTTIKAVTILHETPSDSQHRVSFVVADRRWKWAYRLVVRDYNIPKRTGTRFVPGGQGGPVQILVTSDEYQYRPYSLKGGKTRWTAREAVEDVLKLIDDGGSHTIDSWPVKDDGGDNAAFTMQNVTLRDQGDIALARLLSYVPGAELYIDTQGRAVVFDGANLQAADELLRRLPPNTRDGEKARKIDRAAIRPSEVVVHYQREVECLFEYSDDYGGGTSSTPGRDTPFLENVLPTVDPETEIRERDPETNQTITKTVRQGTWVPVQQWLEAMDDDRPDGSWPWTFDTIKRHWIKGDLEGVLGGRGLDLDTGGNVSLRISALRQHFRQTFRISRRYAERCRDIRAIRVALLDPVTGARAPANVWGQCCIIPSQKGKMLKRTGNDSGGIWRNLDNYPQSGDTVRETVQSAAEVVMLDEDLGIFRVDWLESPYGTDAQIVPCHTANESDQPIVPTGDLEQQEDLPVGPGMRIESGSNGIFLKSTMRMLVMLTIVPAAPNNRWQFHRIRLDADDIADVWKSEFSITDGDGPELHIFVPPGEATARFAWDQEQTARLTVSELLGLPYDDPAIAGIVDEDELGGFVCINEDKELMPHARSMAAEVLAPFCDSIQGRVTTYPPRDGLKLVGNMTGAAIHLAAAPSAKVVAIHDFPGQQKPISRFALLPDSARQIVLGTLPFKGN